MDEVGIWHADGAKVPVWAIKALVPNTVDVLVASITDSVMASVTTWSKEGLGNHVEVSILNSRSKSMLWVVTMLDQDVARNAKIKVITGSTGDKVFLAEFCLVC